MYDIKIFMYKEILLVNKDIINFVLFIWLYGYVFE